jgi:hypothetical protein
MQPRGGAGGRSERRGRLHTFGLIGRGRPLLREIPGDCVGRNALKFALIRADTTPSPLIMKHFTAGLMMTWRLSSRVLLQAEAVPEG